MKPAKKLIRDIKQILRRDRMPKEARENLFGLMVKTKGRMGWK